MEGGPTKPNGEISLLLMSESPKTGNKIYTEDWKYHDSVNKCTKLLSKALQILHTIQSKWENNVNFHPKPYSSENICRKRGMNSFTEHIFKNFLKTQTPIRTRWTVCLAVSTMLISLRYTKIKFQRAKYLITFHNKRSTVVIRPNMKHNSLQFLHKPLFSQFI